MQVYDTMIDLLVDRRERDRAIRFIDGENDDWIQSGPPTLEVTYLP